MKLSVGVAIACAVIWILAVSHVTTYTFFSIHLFLQLLISNSRLPKKKTIKLLNSEDVIAVCSRAPR